MLDCEFLIVAGNPKRARHMIAQAAKANGSKTRNHYKGNRKWIMIWGAGGAIQSRIIKQHLAKGGMVASLDIGYFNRNNGDDSAVRLSINDTHPQNYLKYATNTNERFNAKGVKLQNLYNPDGHILLIGLGKKSRAFLGYQGQEWELNQVEQIRAIKPTTEIIYRPKPRQLERIKGCIDGSSGTIHKWLNRCSLAVVRHSNVAVDCAINNVPCVSMDGAGAYLYPPSIEREQKPPTLAKRVEFLNRLAWFDWLPSEAVDMLKWIAKLDDIKGN